MLGFGQQPLSLGGSVPVYSIPPAPESRILDDAGVLDRHQEEAARISERLKKLESEHGLPTYLVLYSALVVGDVSQRPRELYDAWIGEHHEGVVVVCEIDSRQLEIAFPLAGEGNLFQGEDTVMRLSGHRLVPVIRALNRETAGVTDRVAYLERLTGTLAAELDLVLSGGKEGGETERFIFVTLALGGLIGLLGYLGHRYVSRSEIKTHEQYYFPEVEVSSRLGAPYGGARVNTLSFQVERRAEEDKQS